MSAAGRLNTPGPEQSAHRAVREDALKGQVAGQGVSFHSFVFPDFLEHLVLSLTEFCSAIVPREASPGRPRCRPPQRGGATARTARIAENRARSGSLFATAGDGPTGRARHLWCPHHRGASHQRRYGIHRSLPHGCHAPTVCVPLPAPTFRSKYPVSNPFLKTLTFSGFAPITKPRHRKYLPPSRSAPKPFAAFIYHRRKLRARCRHSSLELNETAQNINGNAWP